MIKLTALEKKYTGFSLGPLNLEVPPGTFLGLVGPNGAGKSTLLRLLLGMVAPTSGTVEVFGLNPREKEVEVRSRIGFVLEESRLWDPMKIKDVNAVMKAFYRDWDREAFYRLCSDFDLPEDKTIKSWSGGMKNRLNLACALSHKAELLVLDEPTAGLDPAVRHQVVSLVREYLKDEGRSVIFSSHITSDLEGAADQLVFLLKGKVQWSGALEDFVGAHRLVKGSPEILTAAQGDGGLIGLKANGVIASGLTKNPGLWETRPGVLVEPTDLEEVFIRYVQEGGS